VRLRCRERWATRASARSLTFGPDVTAADKGDLKVGDVALVYPWLGCGKCDTCVGGDENMCAVKPKCDRRLLRRPAMPTT